MGKFKRYGLPCPCGQSSDAYAIDHEGYGHCFSGNCDHSYKSRPFEKEVMQDDTEDVVEHIYKSHRGISKRVLELYDIPVAVVNGVDTSYIFTYPNDAVKIKRLNPESKSQKYKWQGEANRAGLFGQDKFSPGSKSSVTITEGEHDAPALYDAIGGTSACVSVQSSSTALRDIEQSRDYLNAFDKIILAFDNDEAGRAATKKVMAAGLFDFNKIYHVPFSEYKDANDYVQAGKHQELVKAWKGAKKYTPDNIISTFSEIEEALKEDRASEIGTYPTDLLNNMLYGFYREQVIVVKGMEGIGKTEIFRMMEHHLLKTSTCKLALIHMEEDKSTTIRGVATYEIDTPCNLPEFGVTEKQVVDAYSKAVGGKEDRVFIYTMFGGDDPDDVLDSIRFVVTSGGVDIVFLDHISLLVTGTEEGDERRKLDYLSTKLKKMCKELKFCLVMISHVNDEGQTRGSRNITKIADVVIDLSRDLQADDEIEKNTLWIKIEKNRKSGRTGKGGGLLFNANTFKLEELG